MKSVSDRPFSALLLTPMRRLSLLVLTLGCLVNSFSSVRTASAQDFVNLVRASANNAGGSVRDFYAQRDFVPAWSGDRIGALADFIRELNNHGLHPEIFQFSAWDQQWRNLSADPQTRAQVEVGTTQLALFVVQSAAYGLVPPAAQHKKWKEIPRRVGALGYLQAAMQQPPNRMTRYLLDHVPPQDKRYRDMLGALAKYRKIEEFGGWRPLPNPGRIIRIGMPYEQIGLLRSRLQAEGDLPSFTGQYRSNTLDKTTSDAIKSFQFRHGIEPDGTIGPQTLGELNVSVKDRVQSLIINIDRLRWMPRNYEKDEYLEVNIAESALRYFRRGKQVSVMPVIVGIKGKHQTPVFHGDIDYLVFRPYWNIPHSIAKNKLYPEAILNPEGYMRRNNYQIVKGYFDSADKVLPNTAANLDKVAAGNLLMRQTSGPNNSLGLVKFIFPNDSSVYLHDTPDHSLFKAADRDFSAGCVRVSRPDELAFHLLQQNGGWGIDRVRAAMQDEQNPDSRVNLERKMPVFLNYWTSTVMNDGRVRFDQDIYGHDLAMKQKFGIAQ